MKYYFMLLLALATGSMNAQYKPETVPGDPLGVKIYTLKNGLKVYISEYKDAPRMQTLIAVRTGSRNDPSDATGLAHYLEHMLFKGTSKIASLDWPKEKELLKQISDLYEKHRNTKDAAERKEIYAKIDQLSGEASKLVSTNEYDRMISGLGAKGTNAFTSNDQTVYVNDIPSNELEKWLKIESERMNELVLRLFHTELEAVYEEFNISQDRDSRKASAALWRGLFPNHPYGTQTTIGTGDHLKNPSMEKIHEYFSTYYVPNNMAIIISGDVKADATVAMVEKYFGSMKSKDIPVKKFEPLTPINEPVVKEVLGKEAAFVDVAWRLPGANSRDLLVAELLSGVLQNDQAGIMDIDLIQSQKIQEGYAYAYGLVDHGQFVMHAVPRDGQTLEEARDLMLQTMDKIRKGQFDEALMKAVVKNNKLGQLKQQEENGNRAYAILSSFIEGAKWKDRVQKFDVMSKITKKELVDLANKYLTDKNYVIVFKREGEDTNVNKVEKPKITPVAVNRDANSDFKKALDATKSPDVAPSFVDFKKLIKAGKLTNGVPFEYLFNAVNPTFTLDYIVDMGRYHDAKLPPAVQYLKFLGTDKYTAQKLQQEFFRMGLSFDVFVADEKVYVELSGLDESFAEGVKLFEHILSKAKPDEAAWKDQVEGILKERQDLKKNKGVILRQGMANFARHGKANPFNDVISEEQLRATTTKELMERIHNLTGYEHKIFYYGSLPQTKVVEVLNLNHKVPAKLKPVPAPKKYPELETSKDKVVFVNFPMVQAEVLMISKGTPKFDINEFVMNRLYNTYFGSGLSGIVFQEIRESRALAYSTSASATSPEYADRAHYMTAYVGTQADKLKDAVTAMRDLLNNMPVTEAGIEKAREGLLKQIASERISKEAVYWTYDSNKRKGFAKDIREDVWKKFNNNKNAVKELTDFQQKMIKGRPYTILVLGDKSKCDMEFLKTLGEVEELSLEQVFGF